MSKLLKSITFKNYRGFCEECTIHLADPKHLTILVGPNNTGKSLITRAFAIFKENLDQHRGNTFEVKHFLDSDYYNLNVEDPVVFKFELNNEIFKGRSEPELVKVSRIENLQLCFEIRKIDGIFKSCIFLESDGVKTHLFQKEKEEFIFYHSNEICRLLEMEEDECEELCIKLYKEIQSRVLAFDAIRSFDRTASDFYKNGAELIRWLHEGNSPAEITKCRRKVREWLKNVFNLDEPSTVIADSEKKQLIFSFDDIHFSSDEIGTGYTMLYILLMEIVRSQKEVIIIDEIESHLQPGLVRLLINLIREHGETQYIIATHSSSVLESAGPYDILYRFNKEHGVCKFSDFFRNEEGLGRFREVCNELGVIPGDVLLSNAVIWVEGPSEMFWIRAWLKAYLPVYKKEKGLNCNLIEGLHYSILMTGGSNIAHYGFEEKEISLELIEEDEVLKVLKINPNPFVIMDSDNAAIGSAKSERMLRVAREINGINRYNPKLRDECLDEVSVETLQQISNLWVLKGRELENYAHPQLLKDFYVERSGHYKSKISGVQECSNWDVYSSEQGVGNLLLQRGISGVSKSSGTIIHKNDFARYVFRNLESSHFETSVSGIEKPNEGMILELKNSLNKLITYLLKINNLVT